MRIRSNEEKEGARRSTAAAEVNVFSAILARRESLHGSLAISRSIRARELEADRPDGARYVSRHIAINEFASRYDAARPPRKKVRGGGEGPESRRQPASQPASQADRPAGAAGFQPGLYVHQNRMWHLHIAGASHMRAREYVMASRKMADL